MKLPRRAVRAIMQLALLLAVAVGASSKYGTGKPSMQKGDTLKGRVTRVVDGDSLYLEGRKLRVWGVDAPEVNEPGYEDAGNTLADLAMHGDITCTCVDIDRHGRSIVRCTLADGRDLADAMIRTGWAQDYRKHTHGFYEEAEADARKHRRGLWAGNPPR